MAFDSLNDFFAMGGYGFYVWLAYGLSFLSLAVLIINTLYAKHKLLKRVSLRLAREQRIKNAQNNQEGL